MNKLLIITIFILLISCISNVVGEKIDKDKIYIDEPGVYISVEPHTLYYPGFITTNFILPYTGEIDVLVGVSNEKLFVSKHITYSEPKIIDKSINTDGLLFSSSNYNLNPVKIDYLFDQKTSWYLVDTVYTNAGKNNSIEIYLDNKYEVNTKYDIMFKPKDMSIERSKSFGLIWYIDPWYDNTGGDHEGLSWIPNDATNVGGHHYNISTFAVTAGYTINIIAATTFSVEANTVYINGTLNGQGRGYAIGQGPGEGEDDASDGAGGAGHVSIGARGCRGAAGAGGPIYGSNTDNTFLMGSGGGSGTKSGGSGGGAVHLLANNIYVSGTINCAGNNGVGGTGTGGGAGSGGTIMLSGVDIDVSGTLTVNGGNSGDCGGDFDGGRASGGRIKLFYNTLDTSGSSITYVQGTSLVCTSSGNGFKHEALLSTIYSEYKAQGTITTDSTAISGVNVAYYRGLTALSDITNTTGYYTITGSTTAFYYVTVNKYGYDQNESLVLFNTGSSTDYDSSITMVTVNLTSPTPEEAFNLSFPLINYDITFTWEDVSNYYNLQVAKDVSFNIISVDKIVSTNTSTETLKTQTKYYWRVSSYDNDNSVNGPWSDVSNFSISVDPVTHTSTAIQGIVYNFDTESPINGALVEVYNGTWSDNMIVNSNGYYIFESGLVGGVYYVKATQADYEASAIYTVTLVTDKITNQNIVMSGAQTYYDPDHFVTFTVQNNDGAVYVGVNFEIYIGSSSTSAFSGYTDSTGSVSLILDQDVEHTLNFYSTAYGFNCNFTLYPQESAYWFTVSYSTDEINDVTYDLQLTNESIVFTWEDDSSLLNWLNITITNVSGQVYTQNTSSHSGSYTFTIQNHTVEHCVNVTFNTDQYGQFSIYDCYTPAGKIIPMGGLLTNSRNIVSVFLLVVFAGMFTRRSATMGCLAFAFGVGFFAYINWLSVSGFMVSLLFIIAIGALLIPGREGG